MRTNHHILFAAAALAVASPLSADTLTLSAVRDNTMYSESSNQSNGAGQFIFTGRTGFGGTRRALIRFDPAASIPAGSTITSAELVLEMSLTNAGASDVAVHRALASWGEGTSIGFSGEGGGGQATTNDATWQHRFYNATFWTTPGGEFDPAPSAVTSVDGLGLYSFGPSAGMAADVQGWLDVPSSNEGWVLVGDESSFPTAKRFNGKAAATGQTARLVVTFTPPGPGTSLCTPGQGVIACPCSNPPSGADRGCDNSAGTGGASLAASGVASLAADSVVLSTAGELPSALSIVLQGNALVANGAPFGEGVRCAGGSLKRLRVENAVGGGIVYPDGAEPAVSAQSAALGDAIGAGTMRWYQVYYRDPGLPCPVDLNFNATQAVAILWGA